MKLISTDTLVDCAQRLRPIDVVKFDLWHTLPPRVETNLHLRSG